jgi:hypothetical protein
MNELQFKITGMAMEKRINGYTLIDAECVENKLPIHIKIKSSLSTKDYVKQELTKEYFKQINTNEQVQVNVNDII